MNSSSWRLATVGDNGLHRRLSPPFPVPGWNVTIVGAIVRPLRISLDDLWRGRLRELELPIHCVSSGPGIYEGPAAVFRGVDLADLLQSCEPAHIGGTTVLISRAPGQVGPADRAHETPVETALCLSAGQVLLAGWLNDQLLDYAHGGPIRAVVDGRGFDGKSRYFYKSLKWLTRIECIPDALGTCSRGTWECGAGYGVGGVIGRDKIQPFLALEQPAAFPLRQPRSQWSEFLQALVLHGDVSRLVSGQLHRCVPRFWELPGWGPGLRFHDSVGAAQLRGVHWRPQRAANGERWDLQGVNLSLARLDDAQWGGDSPEHAANLQQADCEGACLRNADLRHVDFRGAYLASVDFRGANVQNARFEGAVLDRAQFA